MSARGRREPPATITETDHMMFTCGDCHVLALELHRRTGWTIWSFYSEEHPPDLAEHMKNKLWLAMYETPDVHMVVQDPDGLFLDAGGRHTLAEIMAVWAPDGDLVLQPVHHLNALHTDWSVQHTNAEEEAARVAGLLLEHFYEGESTCRPAPSEVPA